METRAEREKKPLGQNAEGLSYFRDERCAVERAVQTNDFEDSTLRAPRRSFIVLLTVDPEIDSRRMYGAAVADRARPNRRAAPAGGADRCTGTAYVPARCRTARVRPLLGSLSSSRIVKWFVLTTGIKSPGR